MFHEYPKAMYRHGAYAAVEDAAEEAAMAADGWADWYTDQERMTAPEAPEPAPADPEAAAAEEPAKRKPGRPKKA